MTAYQRGVDLSHYAAAIRDRGWKLSPIEVLNINDGAERALLERFPSCTIEDVATVKALLAVRACEVRSQLGAWTPGKGSWFTREIDDMLADPELNPLFVTALFKN